MNSSSGFQHNLNFNNFFYVHLYICVSIWWNYFCVFCNQTNYAYVCSSNSAKWTEISCTTTAQRQKCRFVGKTWILNLCVCNTTRKHLQTDTDVDTPHGTQHNNRTIHRHTVIRGFHYSCCCKHVQQSLYLCSVIINQWIPAFYSLQ